MDIFANFYDSLKESLTAADMTAREFAAKAGFAESVVYYWLNRTYAPSTQNLLRFADFFAISVDYLFGLTDRSAFRKTERPVPFAERFRFLLQKSGYSQYFVAKSCKIGCSAVSKWLHGGKLPKAETLLKLGELFGCSLDYLLGRTDTP